MSEQLAKEIVANVIRPIMVIATLSLLASCVSTPSGTVRKAALGNGSPGNPWIVTIQFNPKDNCVVADTERDPTICLAKRSGFCVERKQKIVWRSDPVGIKYELFFHPFLGQPFKSDANGVTRKTIKPDAPIANYKYSILAVGCVPNERNTYDPHIRVDK